MAKANGDDRHDPRDVLTRTSDTAWRVLVVGAFAALILWGLSFVNVVVIPALLATFVAALLMPPAQWLRRRGIGRALSTTIVILGGLALLAGFVTLLVPPTVSGIDQLASSIDQTVTRLQDFAASLGLDERQLSQLIEQGRQQITSSSERLLTGALAGAVVVGEVLVGLVLTAVLTIYFVHGGDRLVQWSAGLAPSGSRPAILSTCRVIWDVVTRYVRGIAVVGLFDAVLFGLALWALRVPIALPLAVLTFIGAFLPFVGAFLSGMLAAMVAFVAGGPLVALAVVGAAVVVQQVEGHVLAPQIYGRALALPPVIVIVAIGVGSVVGGILGAFLAAPVAAVLVALIHNANGAPDTEPSSPESATP